MATLYREITTLSNSNAANGKLRLIFDVQQNVIAKQSIVRLIMVEFQSSTRTGTYFAEGSISVNGVEQVAYTSGQQTDRCDVVNLNTYYLVGYELVPPDVTVQHDSSGNASFTLRLAPRSVTGYSDFNIFYLNSTTYNAHIAATSIAVALPQIADTPAVATPISPVNTIEDGSARITFTWAVSNDSGTTHTGSDLQWSTNGSTWVDLTAISGSGTSYSVPANLFPGGTIYWRVRAYNRDGIVGAWSAAATFVSVAAPAAPNLFCDAAPFTTFTWQSSNQQAWRLTVDDTVYGPTFGTGKSFTLPVFLQDGSHSARLEIQGSYGLWSEAVSIVFTVANVSGDAVSLAGNFGIDALLSWETQATDGDYLIYRDSVQIGHTATKSFTDRLALGTHEYFVVSRLENGNYTKSNVVSGMLAATTLAVAAFYGGGWINLRLTENSDSEQTYAESRAYSLRHITGTMYPFFESSPYADKNGNYDCAFLSEAEAAPLMALLGQMVIIKSRGNNVIVGPLVSIEKRHGDFYVAYRFSVPAAHYKDYVDETD